jgi:hypothetical protein
MHLFLGVYMCMCMCTYTCMRKTLNPKPQTLNPPQLGFKKKASFSWRQEGHATATSLGFRV